MLKSLILAGGFATRLRPLSCSKPKLLFPILGTPLLDYMIDWLTRGNVGETVLAVNHLSDKLRMEVASRDIRNKVKLSVEEMPLGTGGPLRLAAPLVRGDDPLLVVNGDVVSDVSLNALTRAHVESEADGTIAVFKVPDTRAFGLVTLDSNDLIVSFEEKSLNKSNAGWINAGVYVLNQSVIDMIPQGRSVSLEREIFPTLALRHKLMGWRHEGFWYDIGKIREYVQANMELLDRSDGLHGISKGQGQIENVQPPSHIGHNCTIVKSAKLGPRAILSPNVRVLSGTWIHDSIVFEDSVLEENCRVDGAVIGEGTTIGRNVIVGRDSVIAGQVRIPDNVVVNPGSVVLN